MHAPAVSPELARRRATEFEEKVGQNWLNKIGITVLVIGIALFLAYKFPTLSNPEKVILGYAVSLAILALGIYLEHSDRYRIFARALIGGGWALTFFVTYAMYFVKYTQVIDTQWVDLVLLFVVAAAMVGHTLRYNSQVVTGLAFLLAFTTVAISQNTVYCLAAGAILAIGLVAIVHRRNWFELEVFGLVASYLNHFIWLRTVIEPMGAHKHMFPEFVPSAVLLCMYWAIYRWSYVARRIQSAAQEHVSTAAALLNTSLLLALMKYQSVHPELGVLRPAASRRRGARDRPAPGDAPPEIGVRNSLHDRDDSAGRRDPIQILRHGHRRSSGSRRRRPSCWRVSSRAKKCFAFSDCWAGCSLRATCSSWKPGRLSMRASESRIHRPSIVLRQPSDLQRCFSTWTRTGFRGAGKA